MQGCGGGLGVNLVGPLMRWTKHRHGHGRDLILTITCVCEVVALVGWVCSPFFLWLWIRSIRLTFLAGTFARSRPLIWSPSFRYLVIYAFITPLDAVLTIRASRVAANLARPTKDTVRYG
jgi:hypothetical protein